MKFRKLMMFACACVLAMTTGSALAQDDEVRIALVVKALGIGFFEAAHEGGQEAAEELGNVELIYTGPSDTTAEGQIAVINSLIAQRVDAIAVSANDTDALVPVLERAKRRGITTVSWDSGVAPEGRDAHLSPSNDALIGRTNIEMAASAIDGDGKIAILSTTPTTTNQNIWIEEMKKALGDYPDMELVATVYGEDMADKSYREAVQLMQSHPDLEAIIAPTTIGIVAAAQAVEDKGRVGEVYVTGLGLPSELASHVKAGSVKSFALWNPIDLGYAATMIAYNLATGEAEAEPGSAIGMGRLGETQLDDKRAGVMGKPTIFNADNVDKFAQYF